MRKAVLLVAISLAVPVFASQAAVAPQQPKPSAPASPSQRIPASQVERRPPNVPDSAPPEDTESIAAIRSVLDAQVAAWNRGDLEGYMAGYWNSPELTFFSGGTITKGWQPTLARYRQRYQSGGREMGKLDFSDTTIEMLGPDSAIARGHWHLAMKDGQQPKGLFTVVFRNFPQGWRIIHDHSSAE